MAKRNDNSKDHSSPPGREEASGPAQELAEAKKASAQVEALSAMGHWVVAIADNIRNPVAGMRAALEVICHQLEIKDDPQRASTYSPEILKHALSMIRQRLFSLNEYVTELVDFAKAPQIYPKRTPIKNLVETLIADMVSYFPFHVDYTLEFDPTLVELTVDSLRLRNALRALIINGVEAASPFKQEQGSPFIRLEVTSHKDATSAAWVAFAVEDNGPGFSEEARLRALEAFYSTKEAGTGLGLYLVQKYILAHGGTVFLENARSLSGARVGFLIPRHEQV